MSEQKVEIMVIKVQETKVNENERGTIISCVVSQNCSSLIGSQHEAAAQFFVRSKSGNKELMTMHVQCYSYLDS